MTYTGQPPWIALTEWIGKLATIPKIAMATVVAFGGAAILGSFGLPSGLIAWIIFLGILIKVFGSGGTVVRERQHAR